jgi:hypothetical protein
MTPLPFSLSLSLSLRSAGSHLNQNFRHAASSSCLVPLLRARPDFTIERDIDAATDNMATEAFNELLRDLNSYIDEIVGPSAFHRFADLPLELRHMVYEQYFADERRSIACSDWPNTYGEAHIFLYIPHGKRWERSTPFLPHLCLTNKTFGAEATSFLMGSALCEIGSMKAATFILNNPCNSRVLDNVRKLDIRNLNRHYQNGVISDIDALEHPDVRQRVYEAVEGCNEVYSQLLGSFPTIHELHVTFGVPHNLFQLRSTPAGFVEQQMVYMDDFLVGFSIRPILALERLEKLVLWIEMPQGCELVLNLGDDHPFAAVKQLGLTIKAEFKELDRNVEVRARWLD